MKLTHVALVAGASITVSLLLPGVAGADPQIAGCTSSYAPKTYAELAPMDSALTIDLFNAIDTNHNGVLCFKRYPNGPHAGHAGNLVDDKSGPKS